jgi:uncharacterized protein
MRAVRYLRVGSLTLRRLGGLHLPGAPGLPGSPLNGAQVGQARLALGENGNRSLDRRFGLALAACLTLFLALSALALDFPALTGRVVDDAGILDEGTRAALTDKLADLEAKTTDQLVVVTLKSLEGTSIEDFGVELGRRWQVGQKDKSNGALLIVAPHEHRVRIEVGYGLEGALTDAVSRLIIENSIIPRFRAGDFSGGITRGVDDIVSVLTGDAEDWKQRAAQRPDTVSRTHSTRSDSIWPVIWVVLIVMGVVLICIMLGGALCPVILRFAAVMASAGGGSRSGGFSGGGGSFGGGGASGRW